MRTYTTDPSVIGVIGPFNSPCASREIAIANRAPGGPLAMISPSTTEVGLTHVGPGSQPGEPGIYYPTGTRNFVRLVPADDVQAAADVLFARRQGLSRVFIAHDSFDPYGVGIAHSFGQAAKRLRLRVAGAGPWPGAQGSPGSMKHAIASFVRTIARTHPNAIFLAGFPEDPPVAPLIQNLRAVIPNAQLIAPDAFADVPDLVHIVGPAVEGMAVSEPEIAPSLLPGPGQQFVARYGKEIGGTSNPWSAYAAQAADVLLNAIAHSNGTRTSVTKALFATRIRNGIIGSFAFTPTGDPTAGSVTIIRVQHMQPAPLRVITPAPRALGGG
jgi:branched-chain amino acid transport system substrate-binding protein